MLHEWLLRTAGRQPGAAAIVEEGRATTFGELAERAATLAASFARRGLAPGDRVALVLPKNTESITSVFATMLAGGVWVPVQPGWPAERIEATLAQCSPRLVVWEDRVEERVPGPPAPADTCFILFTSGSTGRPKGVTISHRAVGAFVEWTARQFDLEPEERLACPAPLSFDLSTFDIFNMALVGAACVILPESIVWMPRFLVRFIEEQRITAWYSVPSILAGMLEQHALARAAGSLRLTLAAGEVLTGATAARWRAAVPGAALYNLYGPTETNVVTWYRVPDEFDPARPVPIGVACPYAELAVDDASGELLVAGESVMSGYWGRPEETEKAFATRGDRRYYRTGDRVWLDPPGLYSFMGRLDRQVKRRGYRIEPGEIEAALGSHPAVAETAVVAAGGEARLGAFVRRRPEKALSELDLRAHCAAILPSYMMPDQIIFLDRMPKGSRGKTDYQALVRLLQGGGTDGHQG